MSIYADVQADVRISDVGLEIPGDLSRDQWREWGRELGRVVKASQWALGDWLRYGETTWGETYDEAIELTGLSYSTLATAVWMSKKFPIERRAFNVPYSHYREVAGLPEHDQVELLTLAEPDDADPAREPRLSTSGLRVQARARRDAGNNGSALETYMNDYAATVSHLAGRTRNEMNPKLTLDRIIAHTEDAIAFVEDWIANR